MYSDYYLGMSDEDFSSQIHSIFFNALLPTPHCILSTGACISSLGATIPEIQEFVHGLSVSEWTLVGY